MAVGSVVKLGGAINRCPLPLVRKHASYKDERGARDLRIFHLPTDVCERAV